MRKQTVVANPFEIAVDPMERLLLINFEGDPDPVYVGFEPQVFADEKNGTGQLVIGWRADGRVDVYHQPGLTLDAGKYDIAGKGLANMVGRELKDSYYRIDEHGVQAYYAFSDLKGRNIELRIQEKNPRKRQPFSLLAPMGVSAQNPSAMPVILLHDFYFIRQQHTQLLISINGKKHQPDKLPLPLDWTRMYFSRYSPDPLIVTFNPARQGPLPLVTLSGATVTAGDMALEIETDTAAYGIKSLQRRHKHHQLTLSFDPAFPNLAAACESVQGKGSFVLAGHPSAGQIRGRYAVENNAGQITVALEPIRWVPKANKASLKFLYTVAKVFTRWPSTYRWTAKITKGEDGHYMRSCWQRVEAAKS